VGLKKESPNGLHQHCQDADDDYTTALALLAVHDDAIIIGEEKRLKIPGVLL
jgi:hypothetical protein